VGDCAPNQSAAGLSAGAVAPERRVFDPPPVACRHGQLARRARPEQRPMRSGRWCVALCRLPPPATVACQQNRPWGGLGGPVSLPKPLESQATSKRRNGGAAQKCAWRGVGQEKICIGDCRRGRRSTNRVPATASNPGDQRLTRCASAMAVHRGLSGGSRVRAAFQQTRRKIVPRCTIGVVAEASGKQINKLDMLQDLITNYTTM